MTGPDQRQVHRIWERAIHKPASRISDGKPQDACARDTSPEALAALAVCEALALALVDAGILRHQDVTSALQDAKTAHANTPEEQPQSAAHRQAAKLIEQVIEQVGSACAAQDREG